MSLGYLEDAKFYLESKALFIDISSIASFKLFLIAWLREYCTFLGGSVVGLKSSPWPEYTQLGTIFSKQKTIVFHYQTFFFFKYVLYLTVLSKYRKNVGGHRARLREKELIFRYRAKFEFNLLRFVRARARVRALMTRKSCAVGMRNAILRNYLKNR